MNSPTTPLAYQSIKDVARQIREGDLSPVDVTETILDRIDKLNPQVHSYYTVFAEEVLAEAKVAASEIASGVYRGPLHGIPVALKDIYDCGPTTCGSEWRRDYVATSEATTVERLRSAGALILGKVAMSEFAFCQPTLEGLFPPARNPWNLDLDAGASSSGSSSVVSAGMAYAALGTDTAGSIRWPAAVCNLVGMKATYGRVSRAGVHPLSWALDHAGPMARTAGDVAALLEVLAGYDPRDPGSARQPVEKYSDFTEFGVSRLDGTRIGVPWGFFEDSCDSRILASFQAAIAHMEELGASVVGVPSITLHEALATIWPPIMADAAAIHLDNMRNSPNRYHRDLRLYLATGLTVTATSYIQAQRFRAQIRDEMLGVLGDVDLLMQPTIGFLPAPIPERSGGPDLISPDGVPLYPMLHNLTGFPAMTVPCGFTPEGLPIGLEIASGPFEEGRILRAAQVYEATTDWVHQYPSI